RRSTWPGGKPRGLLTSAARQTCTSTLPRDPRALECQAASSAARWITSRGSSSSLSGLRTITWLPAGPATCSHRSWGSATPKVSWSFSASPFPTRTSKPRTSSARYPLPLLATRTPRCYLSTRRTPLQGRDAGGGEQEHEEVAEPRTDGLAAEEQAAEDRALEGHAVIREGDVRLGQSRRS